jgi:hypothetical protein
MAKLIIKMFFVKMALREIGCDGVDWIDVARDRGPWMTPVNTVMSIRVS